MKNCNRIILIPIISYIIGILQYNIFDFSKILFSLNSFLFYYYQQNIYPSIAINKEKLAVFNILKPFNNEVYLLFFLLSPDFYFRNVKTSTVIIAAIPKFLLFFSIKIHTIQIIRIVLGSYDFFNVIIHFVTLIVTPFIPHSYI